MGNMQQVHSTDVGTLMSTPKQFAAGILLNTSNYTADGHQQVGDVYTQQARESTRTTCTRSKQGERCCSYWWQTLGWQKSSMPTSRKSSTNSLVWSSSSGVALVFMAPPKHTQAKVGCAGPLRAAVCSSAPQCLETLPPPPIV